MATKFYEDTFEIESLSIGGEDPAERVGLFAGIGLPWDEVVGASVGSSYLRANGDKYRKSGAGDLQGDWTLGFDPNAGGSPSNQCVPFFLANGTQDNIPLVGGLEIPFFLANGTADNIALVTC